MASKVKFIDKEKSYFFATVRERVDVYFKERNLSRNANWLMYIKSTFFLGGLITCYSLILSNKFSPGIMLLLAALLGMFCAFTAFNIGHDAIHGAYSSNPKVNKFLSHSFDLLGANAYMWNITHNVVHHTYTNIPGHDEDIQVAPGLLRLSPEDKKNKIQKYQHLYAFFLYSFASLSWVFRKDYVKFFQKNIGGSHDNTKHPRKEVFRLFFFKFIYYCIFIIIPLVVVNVTWWQFIIGFITLHLAEGLVLGLVFQLAHVVEGTDFPITNDEGNIEEAWAVHQMRTTADFATKSFWATWFCGGLNMQVEHHLFPKTCHIHYPALAEIVKKTAEEFNVPYIENPSFMGALRSHYKMLKRFGIEDQKSAAEVEEKHRIAV